MIGIEVKNPTLGRTAKDHSLDDTTLIKTASHNLDDTNVIDVEVGGVLGHDGNGGIADELSQHVLVSVLLSGNGRANGLDQVGLALNILDLLNSKFYKMK